MLIPNQIIGIDPGRTGAIACITTKAKMCRVFDMPEQEDRGINLSDLSTLLDQFTPAGTLVVLEWNTGRPGEVPDYAFRFGLQTGQLHAMCVCKGFKVDRTSSQKWTGDLGFPGKTHFGAVQQRATEWGKAYPAFKSLIYGPRGGILDGRLDALWMAEWMRRISVSPFGRKGGKRPPKYLGVAE